MSPNIGYIENVMKTILHFSVIEQLQFFINLESGLARLLEVLARNLEDPKRSINLNLDILGR